MLTLTDITKRFETPGGPFTALEGISATIPTGEVTLLIGPSGSGKSTLLSIVGSIARPTFGRIHLGERELTSLPERFRSQIRRRSFGFVFQHYHLIDGLTVLENVMLPAYPDGPPLKELQTRALTALSNLKVADKAPQPVESLSGGERQRVAIARALINDPDIIIADEPTAHLDDSLSQEIIHTLSNLTQQGKTVIISSHDPLVPQLCPQAQTLHLHNGKLPLP